MDLRKIYAIALALSKSQLRTSTSGRAGGNLFRRPIIILIVDIVAFSVTVVLGYVGATILQQTFPYGALSQYGTDYTAVVNLVKEAMIFVPTFVPSSVLLGGILFELNVSSKFSASDTVNWLPITQTEYVIASAISVAYNYSALPSIFLGITLAPAFALGFGSLWVGVALVSIFTLFTGGVLVEILRAAINRVSSLVSGRARRGAFVLRLVLLVVIILVIDTSFNPNVLVKVVDSLSTTLSVVPFIPILWGSVVIEGIATGNALLVALFSAGTVLFTVALVWAAVRVRARYWSPMVGSVSMTTTEYRPHSGIFVRLGLSSSEAAIVMKDLKGVTRRRELLSFFAIPIVFVALFVIDTLTGATGGPSTIGLITDIPIFLAGTIFALMVSSISFGQESKSVMVLYSLPITPDQILKAKAFVALMFSLTATTLTLVIFSVIGGQSPTVIAENLVIAVAITVEEVFIGLAIGAAHPDFQERPRPRFVDPLWLLVMLPLGFGVAFVTGVPIIFRDVLSLVPSSTSAPLYLFPAAVAFAAVVTIFCYRWARGSVRRMMSEYKI
jgi:Putative ATP-binding cassette